ncbi:P-loop containing nucleoside triphosphate hydrolase protein [Nemania sp. FL0031]|nr:P-loop containing nucleoside triphosphate hydrolase protein [Nemania sp. FL0031]
MEDGEVDDWVPNSAWEKLGRGDFDERDLWIAVMGVTGSGKSTFIKKLTKGDIEIGHDLEACTQDVDFFDMEYGGKRIHLIDTPGFDDTFKTDTDILKAIVNWLNTVYRRGLWLSGTVYLHPINHNRVTGSQVKNMNMFKRLCGPNNLPSIALATTMWNAEEHEIQLRRHRELSESENFWGGIVARENVFRHDNSTESAFKIIDCILAQQTSIVLEIQRQMVDEGLSLDQTSAGQELNKELLKQKRAFERRLKEASDEMQAEIAKGNREAAKEREKERQEFQLKFDEAERQRAQLNLSMQRLLDQKDAENRRLLEELKAEHDRSLVQLQRTANEKELAQNQLNAQPAGSNTQEVRNLQSRVAELESRLREQTTKHEQKFPAKRGFRAHFNQNARRTRGVVGATLGLLAGLVGGGGNST